MTKLTVPLQPLGENTNKKFVFGANNEYELVFDENNCLVNDDRYKGTYNYYDPIKNPIGHVFADIIPYLILGNSPSDMVSGAGHRVVNTILGTIPRPATPSSGGSYWGGF